MANGFRILENGDSRITEADVFRVTERFTTADTLLTGTGSSSFDSKIRTIVTQPLVASSQLQAIAVVTYREGFSLAALGSIASTGIIKKLVFSNLNANSLVSFKGTNRYFVNSSLVNNSTIVSSSKLITQGSVSLVSGSSKVSAGERILKGVIQGTATSQQVFTPTYTASGRTNFVGTLQPTINSILKVIVSKSFESTSSLSLIAKNTKYAQFNKSGTSALGVDVSLILYGQVDSRIVNAFRDTEESDLRITEEGNSRITDDLQLNIIFSILKATPTYTAFKSELYVKNNNNWSLSDVFVKSNGVWVNPVTIHKKINGKWKRGY